MHSIIDKNIRNLDIPMHNILLSQIFEPLVDIDYNTAELLFPKMSNLPQLPLQISSVTELSNDVTIPHR